MNAMIVNATTTSALILSRFLTDADDGDNGSLFFKVTSTKHRLGLGRCRTTLYTMNTPVVTRWQGFLDFGWRSASSAAIDIGWDRGFSR
jgi:hypothetical protein